MTQSILSFYIVAHDHFSPTFSCLFILPLCSAGVISTASFIVSCGNGASPCYYLSHLSTKRQQWTQMKYGFIISIKKTCTARDSIYPICSVL